MFIDNKLIEVILEITNGGLIAVTFVLPTAQEITFKKYRKIVNGVEIKTAKKVTDIFIQDNNLFKQLKKRAIYLLVINPPDFSWLKCPFCDRIPDDVIDLFKARRLKEAIGRLVIKCSYCSRYYKIPFPPKSFLEYDIL